MTIIKHRRPSPARVPGVQWTGTEGQCVVGSDNGDGGSFILNKQQVRCCHHPPHDCRYGGLQVRKSTFDSYLGQSFQTK